MTSRVANYEIMDKLDKVLDRQNQTIVAVARIEENLKAHAETLDRHEGCIKENADTEKRWRGVNALITACAAVIASIVGVKY